MSGWAEESESAINLATDAVRRLHKIDPTNELLWFWMVPPEGVKDPFDGDEDKMRLAMKDRFWQKEGAWQKQAGAIVTTVVTGNYFLAVEEEIKRLSPNIEADTASTPDKER
jgi:hypothetical protein